MARARSVEKQQAILQSAVREIAIAGLGASTARIAKGAGLAEGTIFTYFASKDELLNELYIALKTDVYQRIHQHFPHHAALYERARHIWIEYLRWALEKPQEQTVSVLLSLSPMISAVTRERLGDVRSAVTETMEELGKCGAFENLPPGFAASAMSAMQASVLELAGKRPGYSKKRYSQKLIEPAFAAFWRMAQ
jgi:AcrR family transcriptional regulator